MRSGNHGVLNRSAVIPYQNLQAEKLPTLSFTEAVRNLSLNRIQQTGGQVEEATEKLSGDMVGSEIGNEILQASIDDQFEHQSSMKIEHSLEQLCGLANEKLVDIEDE